MPPKKSLMDLSKWKSLISKQILNLGAINQPNRALSDLVTLNVKVPSASTIPVTNQGLNEACRIVVFKILISSI